MTTNDQTLDFFTHEDNLSPMEDFFQNEILDEGDFYANRLESILQDDFDFGSPAMVDSPTEEKINSPENVPEILDDFEDLFKEFVHHDELDMNDIVFEDLAVFEPINQLMARQTFRDNIVPELMELFDQMQSKLITFHSHVSPIVIKIFWQLERSLRDKIASKYPSIKDLGYPFRFSIGGDTSKFMESFDQNNSPAFFRYCRMDMNHTSDTRVSKIDINKEFEILPGIKPFSSSPSKNFGQKRTGYTNFISTFVKELMPSHFQSKYLSIFYMNNFFFAR